jgi:hypothetical protein
VSGDQTANWPNHRAKQMRKSCPPRLAKAEHAISVRQFADPGQLLIPKMVQDHHPEESVPFTPGKCVKKISLPPGDLAWQTNWARGQIKTGYRSCRKPARHLAAQAAVARTEFYQPQRLWPAIPCRVAQGSPHPADVPHQCIDCPEIPAAAQRRWVT